MKFEETNPWNNAAEKYAVGTVVTGKVARMTDFGAFVELDTQVVVNPDTCIDCGVCISECPQGAITTEDEADEKWIKFNAEESQKA